MKTYNILEVPSFNLWSWSGPIGPKLFPNNIYLQSNADIDEVVGVNTSETRQQISWFLVGTSHTWREHMRYIRNMRTLYNREHL